MAFTFTQNNRSHNDASGTSLTVALTGVTAGALIVLPVGWEGADTTITASDGTSSFTAGTHASPNGDQYACFLYLLSANSGNKTYTITWAASRPGRHCQVWEFGSTGTNSFDVQNTGTGASGSLASGTVTTTGTDEVVMGLGFPYGATLATSAEQIGGVSADGQLRAGSSENMNGWYRILTGTASGIAATATMDSIDWVCNIIAFKAASAGGQPTMARWGGVPGMQPGSRQGRGW